jgi:hypothetical protein
MHARRSPYLRTSCVCGTRGSAASGGSTRGIGIRHAQSPATTETNKQRPAWAVLLAQWQSARAVRRSSEGLRVGGRATPRPGGRPRSRLVWLFCCVHYIACAAQRDSEALRPTHAQAMGLHPTRPGTTNARQPHSPSAGSAAQPPRRISAGARVSQAPHARAHTCAR